MTYDDLTDREYGFMCKYAVTLAACRRPMKSPTDTLVDALYTDDKDVVRRLVEKGYVQITTFSVKNHDGSEIVVRGVYLTMKGVELATAIYEFGRL